MDKNQSTNYMSKKDLKKVKEVRIFDSFFIIGLEVKKSNKFIHLFIDFSPIIRYQYPILEDEGISNAVPQFCFPGWPNDDKLISDRSLYFYFALQTGDGSRKYGFCNRVLNDEKEIETLCIITD